VVCADAVEMLRLRREIAAGSLSPYPMASLIRAIDEQRLSHQDSCETDCWFRAIEKARAAA
jgi:hypothetical protein